MEGSGHIQEALWKKSQQGLWADWMRVTREREGLKVNQVHQTPFTVMQRLARSSSVWAAMAEEEPVRHPSGKIQGQSGSYVFAGSTLLPGLEVSLGVINAQIFQVPRLAEISWEPWNMKCSTLQKIKAIPMMNINNEYGEVVGPQPHICPGN